MLFTRTLLKRHRLVWAGLSSRCSSRGQNITVAMHLSVSPWPICFHCCLFVEGILNIHTYSYVCAYVYIYVAAHTNLYTQTLLRLWNRFNIIGFLLLLSLLLIIRLSHMVVLRRNPLPTAWLLDVLFVTRLFHFILTLRYLCLC